MPDFAAQKDFINWMSRYSDAVSVSSLIANPWLSQHRGSRVADFGNDLLRNIIWNSDWKSLTILQDVMRVRNEFEDTN